MKSSKILAFVFLVFSSSALAITLDEARCKGLAKEIDSGSKAGFLEVDADKAKEKLAEVKKLVEEINAKRKEAYASILKENNGSDPNLTLESIAQRASVKIKEKMASECK